MGGEMRSTAAGFNSSSPQQNERETVIGAHW